MRAFCLDFGVLVRDEHGDLRGAESAQRRRGFAQQRPERRSATFAGFTPRNRASPRRLRAAEVHSGERRSEAFLRLASSACCAWIASRSTRRRSTSGQRSSTDSRTRVAAPSICRENAPLSRIPSGARVANVTSCCAGIGTSSTTSRLRTAREPSSATRSIASKARAPGGASISRISVSSGAAEEARGSGVRRDAAERRRDAMPAQAAAGHESADLLRHGR
jgi:hypothetical protein